MANDDLQRLIVSLEAKITTFDNAMKRADGIANKRARAIENRFAAMNKNVSSSFRSGLALAGIGLGARGFQELVDAATRAENALKVAGLQGAELKSVYDQLFASAQRNAAPFEALTTLYGRAALVQKELGVSQQELIRFTDNVAVALRVSGRTAEQSAGALLQLGQALGSGAVRAEEFNSIQEGAQPILLAVASGLKEAGGSVAALRTLVIDGKVSSEAFFRAFEAGAVVLQGKAAVATTTNAQAFEQLKNSIIRAAGQFDDAVGLSEKLSAALGDLSEKVKDAGNWFEENTAPIDRFFGKIAAWWSWLEEKKAGFRSALGLDAIDDFLAGTSITEGRIGFQSTQMAEARRRALSAGLATVPAPAPGVSYAQEAYGPREPYGPPAPPKPVSLNDFASPKGAAGGGGGRAARDFDTEMKKMREQTALLRAETEARARLNPLAADYEQQIDAAVNKVRLLNAAQAQGIKITPEVEASIGAMAQGYAAASSEAQMLADSQQNAIRQMQEMRSMGKDAMASFITDMREGKSATEALAGALDRVADKLLDMALDDVFGTGQSGGGGLVGMLGGLFGGGAPSGGGNWVTSVLPAFGDGGITRGPSIAGERGTPEAVVPLPDGRSIPVTMRMPSTDMPLADKTGGEIIVRVAAGPELYVEIDNRARNVVAKNAPAIAASAVRAVDKNLPAMMNKHDLRSN